MVSRPSPDTVASVATMVAAVVATTVPYEGQEGYAVRFLHLVNWLSLRWYYGAHCLGAIFLVLMDIAYGFVQPSAFDFESNELDLSWVLGCSAFWCMVWGLCTPILTSLFECTVPLAVLCLFSLCLQIYSLLIRCILPPEWALKLPSYLIASVSRRKSRRCKLKTWLTHEIKILLSVWLDWLLREDDFREKNFRLASAAVVFWLVYQGYNAAWQSRLAHRSKRRAPYELLYAGIGREGILAFLQMGLEPCSQSGDSSEEASPLGADEVMEELSPDEEVEEASPLGADEVMEELSPDEEVEDCGICYGSLEIELPVLLSTGIPAHPCFAGFSAFRRRPESVLRSQLSCTRLGPTFASNPAREARLGRLQCGHVFHWSCLESLPKHHRTCPLCRASLYGPPTSFINAVEGMSTKQIEERLYEIIVSPVEGADNLKRAFIFPICGAMCLIYSFLLPANLWSGAMVFLAAIASVLVLRHIPNNFLYL